MAIKRLYDTLVGATVNVNQLVQNGDFADGTTGWSGNATLSVSDNVLSVTQNDSSQYVSQKWNKIANHKCFYTADVKATSGRMTFNGVLPTVTATGVWQTSQTITNIMSSGSEFLAVINKDATYPSTWQMRKVMRIDLTALLGSTIADYLYSLESATAGAGVAKLREWGFFTGEYIPYNPGTLESVEARSHVMTGKNIFGGLKMAQDIVDTVPNATLNETDKTASYSAAHITGKTLYKFPDPNTQYTIIVQGYNTTSGEQATNLAIRYEDGFVEGLSPFVDGVSITVTRASRKVESLVGIWATGGTVLYYEKCGVFRGVLDANQFEPYVSHTYNLGTDTLRGLFKLDSNNNLYADGDMKTSDGTVTRKYGVVDLGTLDFSYDSSGKRWQMTFSPIESFPSRNASLVSDKWIADIIAVAGDNGKMFTVGKGLYLYSTDGTNPPTGTLVYPLATPTTEQSTPFTNPQICDPDGTEEYTTNNGVPVGHETRYQL